MGTLTSVEAFVNTFKRSLPLYEGRIRFVTGGFSPFPGVRFVSTAGHSPDHLSVLVSSQRKNLFVVGDAFISRVRYRPLLSCTL